MTHIRNTPPFPKKAPVDAQARCTHRERDDNYAHVIANPSPRWRIILCRDGVQWIVQKKEASHAGPWRAEGYHTPVARASSKPVGGSACSQMPIQRRC